MLPYNPISPHGQGGADTHPTSAGHQSGAEEFVRMRQKQNKAHLENRLRIAKLEVNDRERKIRDLERDIQTLEREAQHARENEKRLLDELKSAERTATKDEGESKSSQVEMGQKDNELRKKNDEIAHLDREIAELRRSIEEKERKQAEIKEETRVLVREKEDLRRRYELGHFSAQTESGHAHEKSLQALRFKEEAERKEAEHERKKRLKDEIHRELLVRSQEIAGMESELRHLGEI